MSEPLSISPQVRKLLQKGIEHHRAGRMGRAQACYRRSLKADPRCPQALHLMGLIAQQAGDYKESVRWIGQALRLNPDDPDALNSLAESCLGLGDVEQAVRHYRRLVEVRPESAVAHTNLAKTLERHCDWRAAVEAHRRAVELQPESAEAHYCLAAALRQREEPQEARKLLEKAVALDPARAATFDELALVLTDLKDLPGAVGAIQRSMALKPDAAGGALSLGYYFIKCGDLRSAEGAYRRAVQLEPGTSITHFRLAATLAQLGDRAAAWESYRRALALNPASSEILSHISLLHLTEGNFAEGWNEYEHRESARKSSRAFPKPQWKGEPLQGARIFLHAEQGIGDAIQTLRYVPLVASRGGKVILAIQTRLRRLVADTPGVSEFVIEGETPPQFDFHCPLLSLPGVFGTDLTNIPSPEPYIHPDPSLVETWRQRLRGDTFQVGIVWGGNPKHPYENWRSLRLENFAALTQVPGTTFYSLQMGPPAAQVRQTPPGMRLIDLQDVQEDFADTAAIVANLDLVVTIDTSLAHLAGAMGKRVWILLHKSSDWRWLLDRNDSPWYASARLFRQSALGNWQEVLARVEPELRKLVEQRPVR